MISDQDFQNLALKVRSLEANTRAAIGELLIHFFIVCSGFVLSSTTPGWLPGQIILGISFWRSFAILHAAGHRAFFPGTFMNAVTGILCSVFCFIPFYTWKDIHEAHHVWTGWIDLDPTTSELQNELPRWKKAILNFCWKYWIPVISIHYILTVFILPTKRRHYKNSLLSFLSILLVIGIHTWLASSDFSYLRYFGLSSFVYLNMGDISLLTQHVHLPLDHSHGSKVKPKLPREQDQYSHTMILPDHVTRWIACGFNYHSLHHLFPKLPYYYSHLVSFRGAHTHGWKEWILKAKGMKASELIYSS